MILNSARQSPVTLHRLNQMRRAGEKIAMLTCYDATFARVLDAAGVDALLVGDSLGMVIQGRSTTLPVNTEEIEYHTRCVASGSAGSWIIADMPFGSYHESIDQAVHNAVRLMQCGAHMVKLEGGWTAAITRALTERGIPVCAHLGFTPQSVHALGGYRIQARADAEAELLKQQAQDLAHAGAGMLVLELIPSVVARELATSLSIPVIGIGAGKACSGQVLVLHDMLGLTQGKQPRFVRNFADPPATVEGAVRLYVSEVKSGRFPNDELHGY
jgi:3-methyl-2-oxobutanoate hydroxymethyltransferase